jgi:hypothetical protein
VNRWRRGHHEGVPKRRPLPHDEDLSLTTDPLAAWGAWVASGMQQQERELSPLEKSTPSALILVPLLGLPAVLVIGMVLALVLS